jgi:hypothetical protein
MIGFQSTVRTLLKPWLPIAVPFHMESQQGSDKEVRVKSTIAAKLFFICFAAVNMKA